MVHARWAVACLPLVVLIALGSCSANKVVQVPTPEGGVENITGEGVAPAQIVAPADPEYRMGAEDQIRVSVWENRDLTLDLIIRPDGKISMPLIQDVVAQGLTPTELADTIHQKLRGFIKEPQVSILVLQVNAPKYFIIGSVAKPGTYSLRSETSILQALALAGGFTQFASPKSIKLIRNTAGKQEVRKINYYDVIDVGGEGNFLLKSGDTIVVP